MDKEFSLRLIKLLSGVETAMLMSKERLPDHLFEEIDKIIVKLSSDVLGNDNG